MTRDAVKILKKRYVEGSLLRRIQYQVAKRWDWWERRLVAGMLKEEMIRSAKRSARTTP